MVMRIQGSGTRKSATVIREPSAFVRFPNDVVADRLAIVGVRALNYQAARFEPVISSVLYDETHYSGRLKESLNCVPPTATGRLGICKGIHFSNPIETGYPWIDQ